MKTPLILVLIFLLAGCQTQPESRAPSPQTDELASQLENELATELFEQAFQDLLALNPQRQTRYGIHDNDDEWTNPSLKHARRRLALQESHWETIQRSLDKDKLDARNRLSYELFGYNTKMARRDLEFWWHGYPVNQMFGVQSRVPAFLINVHPNRNVTDLENYIARLKGIEPLFNKFVSILETQEQKGIMPPAFVYEHALNDCRNIIAGAPFDDGEASPLLRDFEDKLRQLQLTQSEQTRLKARARDALSNHVGPAYRRLIAYLKSARSRATGNHGAWSLPRGDEWYRYRLNRYTTTDLSAAEIHALGLSQVDRIHDEMREIMAKVGFEGDLADFFHFMRTDEQFYLKNTEAGKQTYLDMATTYINDMREALPKMVGQMPQADLVVKAVEPYREKSAGKAFYNRPSPDGTRPGIFYVNLYDVASLPIYELEALAYHEGIPGHHLQIATAQQLDDIPKFRRLGHFTAYSEGWGLYAERFPKQFGFYEDPYSDFGRLAMELWRAVRLVVDTGIHDKQWTREQAIDYFDKETPFPRSQAVKQVERYMVMPGQATSYMIGMLRILELREKSKERLGDKFDLAEFHDVILQNGPLPMSLVERVVDRWLNNKTSNARKQQ